MENMNETNGAEFVTHDYLSKAENKLKTEDKCFCESMFLGDVIEMEMRFGEGRDAYSYRLPDSLLWP